MSVKPERIDLEENKEGIQPMIHPPPRHGVQTRSQGPVSFGEEVRREIVDDQGNIIWRGTIHELSGKEYSTADYI